MKAKIGNIINQNRNKLQDAIPLDTPYSINIDPSNLCNFKCKFCAIQTSNKPVNFKKQVMSIKLFKKIVDDISKFPSKLKVLRITGQGEPLINKNISEMIEYAKKKDVAEFIEIITNGSLLSPELNRNLVNSGLDRIRISVESLDEKGYEQIAGSKIDFEKFVENIKDLYNNKGKCEVYIKTVDVALENKEKEQQFYDTFGDICDKIFIDNIIPLWSDFEEMKYSDKFKNINIGVHGQKIKEILVCPYVFYSFIINPDGEITVCCADWQRKLVVGDVSKMPLIEIWNGEKLKKFWHDMLNKNKDKYEMCRKCVLPTFDCNDNIDAYAESIIKNYKF
jgi:radical SAM protein with 4Fe4S-binding SPASM domain